MNKIIIILIAIAALSVATTTADASVTLRTRHQQVLGATTVTMPPTTDGPGIFLPSDPLFFLDELKQQVRVFFAPTLTAKAQVHVAIAGERLAELRYMLAKNDQKGIDVDLQEFSSHVPAAGDALSQAKFAGNNVEKLAKELNDRLTAKQKLLDIVALQSQGVLKAKMGVADASLTLAKEKVEDCMSQDELAKAIQNDLQRLSTKNAYETLNAASLLVMTLKDMQDQLVDAGQRSLANRQRALQKAIADKNIQLQKIEQAKLDSEMKKQNEAYRMSDGAIKQAEDIIQKAQTAAKNVPNS